MIFSALCFSGRRNKIVTDSMHFPSILYLINEQRKFSAEIEIVPSHDGISIDTNELIDHIDDTTAIVNVSHVLFKSAYIHDVAAITEKARRVGAMTLIDGYQAVGTIPVDVRALGVDAYIGGCLKWLCGGPGNAFLWVDPAMRGRLAPALTGWMAHQRPFAFEPAQDRRGDAWRLLNGTPSIPALYAAIPGLQIINEVGIDAIRETSQRHTKRLLELADREGYPCTTPRDPARRGGTVAINVENAYEISQGLKALDILCDFRPGAGIRFSPHFYNVDSEIDAAIEAIREIRSTGAWRAFAASSIEGYLKMTIVTLRRRILEWTLGFPSPHSSVWSALLPRLSSSPALNARLRWEIRGGKPHLRPPSPGLDRHGKQARRKIQQPRSGDRESSQYRCAQGEAQRQCRPTWLLLDLLPFSK